MIMEGLHALNPMIHFPDDTLRSLRVYVSPADVIVDETRGLELSNQYIRLCRRIYRDRDQRGSSEEETIERSRSVNRGERLYIAPFLNNVGVWRVDTLLGYELFIHRRELPEEKELRVVPCLKLPGSIFRRVPFCGNFTKCKKRLRERGVRCAGALCPVCGGVLTQGEKAGICSSGHSFDRAKSGYVNLLVARQSGAQHGDDKEMVRARRAFLDGGWYAPLRCALGFCCGAACTGGGYGGSCWTRAAANVIIPLRWLQRCAQGKCVGAAGVDISKDALRWGGKRAPDLQLAVASVFRLPVAAKSCDILLNVFAPLPEKNTSGAAAGWCAAARRPDAMHLWELKEAVYETPYRNDAAPPVQVGLSLVEEEHISAVLHLCGTRILRICSK